MRSAASSDEHEAAATASANAEVSATARLIGAPPRGSRRRASPQARSTCPTPTAATTAAPAEVDQQGRRPSPGRGRANSAAVRTTAIAGAEALERAYAARRNKGLLGDRGEHRERERAGAPRGRHRRAGDRRGDGHRAQAGGEDRRPVR
jgi:hypothetical protein